MVRIRRVTADIDSKSKLNLLYRLYQAIKLNPEYLMLTPSSNKGYHLVVWTRKLGNVEDMRKKLGDDPKRIIMDRKHKIGKQTLFQNKRKIGKKHPINSHSLRQRTRVERGNNLKSTKWK